MLKDNLNPLESAQNQIKLACDALNLNPPYMNCKEPKKSY